MKTFYLSGQIAFMLLWVLLLLSHSVSACGLDSKGFRSLGSDYEQIGDIDDQKPILSMVSSVAEVSRGSGESVIVTANVTNSNGSGYYKWESNCDSYLVSRNSSCSQIEWRLDKAEAKDSCYLKSYFGNGGYRVNSKLSFQVKNNYLIDMSSNNNSFQEGASTKINIGFNEVASFDRIINLSSTSAFISYPSSVTIPAGKKFLSIIVKASDDLSRNGDRVAQITAKSQHSLLEKKYSFTIKDDESNLVDYQAIYQHHAPQRLKPGEVTRFSYGISSITQEEFYAHFKYKNIDTERLIDSFNPLLIKTGWDYFYFDIYLDYSNESGVYGCWTEISPGNDKNFSNNKSDIQYIELINDVLPDLKILDANIPNTVEAGQLVTNSSVHIANTGSAVNKAFSLEAWLSKDNILDSSDIYIHPYWEFSSVWANLDQEINKWMAIPSGISAGQYYIFVKIDGKNAILESNESNNIFQKMITVLSVDTDGDSISDNIDNCKNIYNSDQQDLDKDNLGDVCDSDLDGDSVENDQDSFPNDSNEWLDTDKDGIGNNADTDDDGDGMLDTWETLYGLNTIDASDAVLDKDSDGLTNKQEHDANTDPTDANDYPITANITSINYEPSPTAGMLSTITVTGTELPPTLVLNVEGCTGMTKLPGATATSVKYQCTFQASGLKYLVRALDKPNGRVFYGTTVSVAEALPDLQITGLNLPSTSIPASQTRTATVTVKNAGQGAAGASILTLKLSADNIPNNADDVLLVNFGFSSLNAAQEKAVDVAFTVPATTAPKGYQLFAIIDSANAITETDETNNQAKIALTVTAKDMDDDGHPDDVDDFDNDKNEWLDTDKDGVGNNADIDDDGDGITDATELQDGTNPLVKTANAPFITPNGGTFDNPVSLVVGTYAGENAVVHYTLDGSTPTAQSPVAPPLTISQSTTLKLIAIAPGLENSKVVSATFVVNKTPSVASVLTFSASATLGEETIFAVSGFNLPDTLAFYIPDCANVTKVTKDPKTGTPLPPPTPPLPGMPATMQVYFSCTPTGAAGVRNGGLVKDKSGGTVLKTFSVEFKAASVPAPVITGISPTSLEQSFTDTTVVLQGSGFLDGAAIAVKLPDGNNSVIPAENIQSVTEDEIIFLLRPGAVGTYQFQVKNTPDKVSGWISLDVKAANDAAKIIPIIMQLLIE